jgi:RNA polymerase sigma-70 factor (ECF subfamily)
MNQYPTGSDHSLENFRAYLRYLAQSQLGCAYSAKLDPSDIVQQTLLDAHQKLGEFRGSTDHERAAWLREIFVNNLADVYRALNRQKRDIKRERSSARLATWLESLPTAAVDEVDNNEQLLRLAWALSELPESQHIAIDLHHLQGRSLAETAKALHRSEASVAGLIRRGMVQLRQLLNDPALQRSKTSPQIRRDDS